MSKNELAQPGAEMIDVAICGLGPTGLTLAHFLGQRGLNVVVLEREPAFYGNARAVYTDDECLRIFQGIGMAEELVADMLQDTPTQWVLPDGSLLNQYLDLSRPNGWSVANFFYQPSLETSLTNALVRYSNVHVQRGREVLRYEQDPDGVTIYHAATEGLQYGKTNTTATVTGTKPQCDTQDVQAVRARYFVACDGGRSVVRTQMKVKMTGQSFPNPWLVVDIKQKEGEDALRHLPYFNFHCDPACPTVSCTQPNGHHRFEFMLMPGQTREYMEAPATIRQLLSKYVDVDKFEILRSLVYTFNALVAENWRQGRVFLAGDAAHMTPQFIGQGMNAGVRDAYNLAWKLDAVLAGRGGDRLLDTYQTERMPHAQAMIDTAVYMKDFVSMANPIGAMLRNVIIRAIQATPYLRDALREGKFIPKPKYEQGQYFGLSRRKRSGPEGRLMPQPTMRGPDGRAHLLDTLLGEGYALLGHGIDPRSELSPGEVQVWDALGARYAAVFPYAGRPQGNVARSTPRGLLEIEDLHGELLQWFRAAGHCRGAVAIIRPDKFVFAVVAGKELVKTTQAVTEQLQLQSINHIV